MDKLTIIITTSPIRIHPSTLMLDNVINSFLNVEGLIDCKKIIICDGYTLTESKLSLKSGIITDELQIKYKGYIENIIKNIENGIYKNTDIIVRDKRYGFASNVEYLLDNYVKTQYVMIVQHDHNFIRKVNFSISEIISGMEKKNKW